MVTIRGLNEAMGFTTLSWHKRRREHFAQGYLEDWRKTVSQCGLYRSQAVAFQIDVAQVEGVLTVVLGYRG